MNATDDPSSAQLQAKVDAARSRGCSVCNADTCGHEILFSIAMGLGHQPQCVSCLARGMGRPRRQLRDHLRDHFRHRDCYGEVWRRENEREGFAGDSLPQCLWSAAEMSHGVDPHCASETITEPSDELAVIGQVADVWDAGEMACGDLVLALRTRMNALPPGARLKLTARDQGAVEDIPAWSRMTGHALLAQRHPHYWIQRKE